MNKRGNVFKKFRSNALKSYKEISIISDILCMEIFYIYIGNAGYSRNIKMEVVKKWDT